MAEIMHFFNNPSFAIIDLIGKLVSILELIFIITFIVLIIKGIFIVLYRLGRGLLKRNIVILSSGNNCKMLESTITESGLFKKVSFITKNDIQIIKEKDVLLIIDRESLCENNKNNENKNNENKKCIEDIKEIIRSRKSHQVPVIIYAKPQSIPRDEMEEIVNQPNVVVVNSRGRLLNDIITSLITTSL